jgi:hypothetical protein
MSVLHSAPMRQTLSFFAYFWFSPVIGGWEGKRT